MNFAAANLALLGPAMIVGLLVTLALVPLGIQVIGRGIVFIDLAIAQIAGLGVIVADVLGWHSTLYAGCAVPVAGYLGHFRGDVTVPDLVGYEAGFLSRGSHGCDDLAGVGDHESGRSRI